MMLRTGCRYKQTSVFSLLIVVVLQTSRARSKSSVAGVAAHRVWVALSLPRSTPVGLSKSDVSSSISDQHEAWGLR
ncbi:hypothetical protein BDV12DRAFT_67717 [Aspergillus spectabilis]